MNAQNGGRFYADEFDAGKAKVRSALEERMQRWAKWQLSGRPLEALGLPTRSTLAGIQSLRLTQGVAAGGHTAHARQSTVAKSLREETHREEEMTERAVFELGKVWGAYPMFLRAEYLWIVPIWDTGMGAYQPRRIMRDQHERQNDHRRRMAVLLGRSLERYLQIIEEAKPALVLLIEEFDDGWIDAATAH